MAPDGPEQRTADLEERFNREFDELVFTEDEGDDWEMFHMGDEA